MTGCSPKDSPEDVSAATEALIEYILARRDRGVPMVGIGQPMMQPGETPWSPVTGPLIVTRRECGTEQGWLLHRARGEYCCDRCRRARRTAEKQRQNKSRSTGRPPGRPRKKPPDGVPEA